MAHPYLWRSDFRSINNAVAILRTDFLLRPGFLWKIVHARFLLIAGSVLEKINKKFLDSS